VITGNEVVSRFANEVDYLDFDRTFNKAVKVEKIETGFEVTTRGGQQYQARALIVATGALGRLMDVPGEKEYMMRGLCYSAVSYAPLFIDRDVVVIGDTLLALRSTAELARIAHKIVLVAPTHGQLDSPMGKKCFSQKMLKCWKVTWWRLWQATNTPALSRSARIV
jgi:thioredoxin reductase